MSQAAVKSTTPRHSPSKPNPDAGLLAMIQQHDSLWAEWDRLIRADEKDPRCTELSDQCSELERKIFLATPQTARGVAGKRHILKLTNFELYGAEEIIAMILEADAERIAAR